MRTKIGKQYILIPLIYIGIIITLLYFQYSTDESFTRNIGNITITGEKSQTAVTGKRGLSSLHIEAYGFTFSFDDSDPVLIETRDGLIHKAFALSFTPYSDGVDIDLGKGLSIRFLLENDDLRIQPSTSTIESIEKIRLPVRLQPSIETRIGSGLPVLAVSDTLLNSTFFVTLQEGVEYDGEAGYFDLKTGEHGFRELSFRSAPPGIEDPFTFWFAGKANFPSVSEFEDTRRDFLSRAREGWETSRYSRERGTWKDGVGSEGFSEKIAVILLSEGVGTGRFTRVRETITAAAEGHRGDLTRLSAPFLGDIIQQVNRYIQGTNRTAIYTSLLNSARNGDPALFSRPDLADLLAAGNREFQQTVMKAVSESDLQKIDIDSCLGILNAILTVDDGNQIDLYIDIISEIIDTRIISSLVVLDEGVYLSGSDKHTLDILRSVSCGNLLRKIAQVLKNETYDSLGRSLIVSALDLSDKNCFLPAVLETDGLTVQRTTGMLAPEDIYLYLTDNEYYPREYSLTEYFGEGSWIYSCAKSVSVESGKDHYTVTFNYPSQETHYIAIHGLPPFSRMKLLGIDWKGDPIFQYYYSGWYYDEDTSTLFIKLRHRSEQERIEIFYEAPAQTEPEPPAPEVEPET